ncbi:MAG TPA: hypothetical protein P5107_00540 [Thermotogota bacterium]|nr:hypothetical protein [Thermotogota bacterium]HRW33526.1 hypothetical protein [Thermotogota bacterium]
MRENDQQEIRHIFGLDFGTSNTHMSISAAAEAVPIVDDVKIESNASIPSVLLYDERNFEVLGFGQPALEEWYSMSHSERKKYTLGTGFKQRIAFNKRAETETELFLDALFSNLNKQKIFDVKNFINNTEMVCGVPSKTLETHTEKLSAILFKIVQRNPILIEEPLGALYYHIIRKDITKEDGRGGVLVIDFGGGTLDFAYIKNFQIQKVWGSPIIGGVLFDDLFYNIFLEQNPGIISFIEYEGLSGYLRTVLFKNQKEKYSILHATSEHAQLTENIVFGRTSYGTLIIPDFEYLYDKMTHYRMSDELKLDLSGSQYLDKMANGERINLPQIITDEVLRSRREFDIRSDNVSLIILTGGSSRWKFFVDLIEKEFPYTRILASSDPESTISRGLGLCYSAKLYEMKVRNELLGNKTELTKRLGESYKKVVKDTLSQYIQGVYAIYSKVIDTVLSHYFQVGGSISQLEEEFKKTFSERQSELDELNGGFKKEMNYRIEEKTIEELSRWFSRSFIHFDYIKQGNITEGTIISPYEQKNVLNDAIYSRITMLSSVIVGVISGTVMGGSGVALIASGPLGWLGGFITGVLLVIASSFGLKKQTTNALKQIKIPRWMLKGLLISKPRMIKNAEKKLQKDLNQEENKIYEQFLNGLKSNDQRLNSLIEEQIQKISYSNIVD